MEIDSIPEAEEEHEVEKSDCGVSNIGMSFNRVDTEYGEEEQSYDLYSIEEIFESYQAKSLIYSISLLFYLISLYNLSEPSLSFFPLLLYEVFHLYKNVIQFKEELSILTQYWKSEFLLKSLDNFFQIVLFSYLLSYISNYIPVLYPLIAPLFLNSLTRVVFKVNTANSCISFSNIIISSFHWAKLVFFINLALKIDFFVSLSWAAVFWPVFLLSSLSLLICLASLIMILLNICTKEHEAVHFYSHLWVIYTFFTGSLIFLLLFLYYDPAYPLWVLAPMTYFLIFTVVTYSIKKRLAVAWWEIFINDTTPNPHVQFDNPLPIPGSQKVFIESTLANKLTLVLKNTPRILVKLTHPQIQTKVEKLQRKKMCRTLSQAIDTKSVGNVHIRSKSSFIAGYNFDSVKTACKFCGRKDGLNKFLECGHGELCNDCGEFYLKSKKECYVCHSNITGFAQEGRTVNTENFK